MTSVERNAAQECDQPGRGHGADSGEDRPAASLGPHLFRPLDQPLPDPIIVV
jgi:hypothetical protein